MSRAPSRNSSTGDASTAAAASAAATAHAARLGAATAFSRPALHTRTSSSASYLSAYGALSAASSSHGRSISPSPVSPGGSSRRSYFEERDEGTGMDGSSTPRPNTAVRRPIERAKSPSQYAASLAAARAPPASMMGKPATDGRARARTVQRPSAPPKPIRLSRRFSKDGNKGADKKTDDTSIPPTTSLVNLFEQKVSLSRRQSVQRPHPDPIVIAPSPDLPINSPKPVRSSTNVPTMFSMELDGVNERETAGASPEEVSPPPVLKSSSKSPPKTGESTAWDPNTRSFRPASEVQEFKREISAAQKIDDRRSSEGKHDRLSPHGATKLEAPSLRSPELSKSPTFPNERSHMRTPSLQPSTSDPVKIQPSSQPSLDGLGEHSPSSFQSAASVTAQYHQLYPKKITPSMTGDQLANAMVASSLASSRTNSPRPHGPKLEPPPPPTRRQKHKFSFSRTPSPAAKQGMLHTLRKVESDSTDSDSDDLHPYSKHRKDKHRLVRKHPHKHHEGDRKRWREAVTERERKRYEGVWAANRNLHLSFTTQEQRLVKKDPDSSNVQELEVSMQEQVSNLVTREVWGRSRLPADTLEMVWELVDGDSVGRLSKAEFVVGLWLIDQRLKGRKLPVKVSESVWASVRGLHGIKIRKSIK